LTLAHSFQYYLDYNQEKGGAETAAEDDHGMTHAKDLIQAVLCAVAWLAPELRWNGKSKSS
jgi:hypothetical protein